MQFAIEASSQPQVESPIFIIGSPRSGTTILAWALAAHSQLWTGGEFHLFWRLFGDGRLSTNLERELTFPGVLNRTGVTEAEFLADLGSGFNALFTRKSGGRRWIDQTPVNTFIADMLAVMFPSSMFLHILRDGTHAVESMIHFDRAQPTDIRDKVDRAGYFPEWAVDFSKACSTWTKSVESAMQFSNRNPERCLTVRYEQLNENPDSFFADILRFLKCPYENGPTKRAKGNRINSSFGNPLNAPAPRRQPWETWTDEQRESFTCIAGDTMKRWLKHP